LIFYKIFISGFIRDYSTFSIFPNNLNIKIQVPRVNKPGINIQILSDSEVNLRSKLKEINEIKEKDQNLQDIYNYKRIQDIKNMQNNNQAILKMKKQMEIKRNFEEIFKEVEQKTLEFEKKIFGNYSNNNTNININTNSILNKNNILQNDINLLGKSVKVFKTKNFISRNSKSVELNEKAKVIFPKINK
jgi:hypothetical protein